MVATWWQQARSGVDTKVESIAKKINPNGKGSLVAPSHKKVHFSDPLVSVFDNELRPDVVGQPQSITLENGGERQEEFPATPATPATPQERRIPPIGLWDSIRFVNGKIQSIHPTHLQLFPDDDIVEIQDVIRMQEIGDGVFASYTKHGRAIIQQQATRGCTAATAAMLIMDNEGIPNIYQLKTRNLGDDDDQLSDIQKAGLVGDIKPVDTLQDLRELLLTNGSAVVTLGGAIGAHVVVVDDVSEDLSKVRLRDPYHGWEITVKQESFLKEWRTRFCGQEIEKTVIQIQKIY